MLPHRLETGFREGFDHFTPRENRKPGGDDHNPIHPSAPDLLDPLPGGLGCRCYETALGLLTSLLDA